MAEGFHGRRFPWHRRFPWEGFHGRYVCDWTNDEQPYAIKVPQGQLFAFHPWPKVSMAEGFHGRRFPWPKVSMAEELDHPRSLEPAR